tara:strand:+ start:29 stop:367 length:339 start_codon:yes stop_codon:yes gene_type:complete
MTASKLFSVATMTAAASITGAAQAVADQGAPGYYYDHPMWGSGWGHMFMGWGMMAVFMIALVLVVVFLIKGLTGTSTSSSSTALDILNERYARGEIDTAEYNERKKTISGNS